MMRDRRSHFQPGQKGVREKGWSSSANDLVVPPLSPCRRHLLQDGAVEGVFAKYCHVGQENPSRVFSTKVDEKLVLLPSLGGVQKRLLCTALNLPESPSSNSP